MTARQLYATALTALVSIVISNSSKAADADFKPMFDGKSTSGWTKPFDWGEVAVTDGEIILTGSKKFFLVTEKTYKNFVLEGEVFCPKGGNSGFQFRCHFQKNKLWGYQAEVDTSDRKWAGGLYDEGRRGWLVSLKDKPEAQWDAETHIRRIHLGFPNLAISGVLGDHCLVSQIFPGPTPESTITRQNVLSARKPETEEEKQATAAFSDIVERAVRDEDYAIGYGIQRGLKSGALQHFTYGRNEPGVQHFHRMVAAHMARDPDKLVPRPTATTPSR